MFKIPRSSDSHQVIGTSFDSFLPPHGCRFCAAFQQVGRSIVS